MDPWDRLVSGRCSYSTTKEHSLNEIHARGYAKQMQFLAECFQGCQYLHEGNKRRGGFTPRHPTKDGDNWLALSRVAWIIVFIPSLVQAQAKKPPSHPKQVANEAQGTGYAHNHARLNSCHSRASTVYLINSS
jgi:hypothetical protein